MSAAPHRPLAGRVAITALAQFGTMAAGGLLALLIGRRFGTSPDTDGLFAAYSVYGVIVMVAQSLRLTMVPRLANADGAATAFADGIGALCVIAALGAIVLVGLGGPVATILVGSGPDHHVAEEALRLFWLAATAQLAAGFGAARLAAVEHFGLPAGGYLAGSLLPVVALAAWPDPDVLLVPWLIAGGAAITAVTVLGAALRDERGVHRPQVRGSVRTAGQMVTGALGSVMWQIALVASLAFASRIALGAVTVYSYAFFAAGLVTSVTSGAIAMVIAAPLTAGWDRGDPRPLEPALLGMVRTSTMLAAPILGLAALVGDDVIRVALGSALSGDEVAQMRDTFLAFSGVIIAASVSPVAALAVYARARFLALAMIEVGVWTLHIGLSALVATSDDLVLLAVVASGSSWAIGLSALWFVWRGATPRLTAQVFATVLPPLLLAAGVFIPLRLVAAAAGSTALAIAGAVAGLVAFALLARRLLPAHWAPVAGALGSLIRR